MYLCWMSRYYSNNAGGAIRVFCGARPPTTEDASARVRVICIYRECSLIRPPKASLQCRCSHISISLTYPFSPSHPLTLSLSP
jgi:hypothetical protein